MKFTVYWLQFAEGKLDDIYDYHLEKAGENIALQLVSGIIEATLILENQPESGPIENYLNHRQENFRYLVYKNYKIIYWVNHEWQRVEIANVFDTRQNPSKMSETF